MRLRRRFIKTCECYIEDLYSTIKSIEREYKDLFLHFEISYFSNMCCVAHIIVWER